MTPAERSAALGRCALVTRRRFLTLYRRHTPQAVRDGASACSARRPMPRTRSRRRGCARFAALPSFRGESSFSTWLIGIGIRCALEILRKRRLPLLPTTYSKPRSNRRRTPPSISNARSRRCRTAIARRSCCTTSRASRTKRSAPCSASSPAPRRANCSMRGAPCGSGCARRRRSIDMTVDRDRSEEPELPETRVVAAGDRAAGGARAPRARGVSRASARTSARSATAWRQWIAAAALVVISLAAGIGDRPRSRRTPRRRQRTRASCCCCGVTTTVDADDRRPRSIGDGPCAQTRLRAGDVSGERSGSSDALLVEAIANDRKHGCRSRRVLHRVGGRISRMRSRSRGSALTSRPAAASSSGRSTHPDRSQLQP